VKLPAHGAALPGNVDMVTRSAFLPAYEAGIQPTCPPDQNRGEFKGEKEESQ